MNKNEKNLVKLGMNFNIIKDTLHIKYLKK